MSSSSEQIAQAEIAHLRHDLSVAKNWAEHHSKHADDLIAENAALLKDVCDLVHKNELLRAAGNEMARIIDIPGSAPLKEWATDNEIDAALEAWRAALGGAK